MAFAKSVNTAVYDDNSDLFEDNNGIIPIDYLEDTLVIEGHRKLISRVVDNDIIPVPNDIIKFRKQLANDFIIPSLSEINLVELFSDADLSNAGSGGILSINTPNNTLHAKYLNRSLSFDVCVSLRLRINEDEAALLFAKDIDAALDADAIGTPRHPSFDWAKVYPIFCRNTNRIYPLSLTDKYSNVIDNLETGINVSIQNAKNRAFHARLVATVHDETSKLYNEDEGLKLVLANPYGQDLIIPSDSEVIFYIVMTG